jgi:hypothetical protein
MPRLMNDISRTADPSRMTNDSHRVMVTAVTNWTPSLFSFEVERPQNFRFRSGEFAMLGLIQPDGRPSICASIKSIWL